MGNGPDITQPATFINKMSPGTFVLLVLAAVVIFMIIRIGLWGEHWLVGLTQRAGQSLSGAMQNGQTVNDPLAEAT